MSNMITIGKIVAPHGVRGDVRVIPLTDFPDRFQQLKEVILEDGQILPVQYAKNHKKFVILKFRGLDSMNTVEKLRGKTINIRREDVVPLPEGNYYIFEIIGLKVHTVGGEYLGTVTDVLQTGSNDVYVAEKPGNNKPILIPALKEVVYNIDIQAGQMTVNLQEEWD